MKISCNFFWQLSTAFCHVSCYSITCEVSWFSLVIDSNSGGKKVFLPIANIKKNHTDMTHFWLKFWIEANRMPADGGRPIGLAYLGTHILYHLYNLNCLIQKKGKKVSNIFHQCLLVWGQMYFYYFLYYYDILFESNFYLTNCFVTLVNPFTCIINIIG